MKLSTLASLACGTLLATSGLAFGADHVDSPLAINDPAADLNDIYTFVNPNDPQEVIYISTVNPFATSASRFSDAVVYDFRLQNGVGVTNRIVCTFSNPDAELDQTVTCTGPGDRVVSGPINQTNTSGDFRVFAGLTDDPFFFDSNAFKATVAAGAPQFTNPGVDFFGGFNVLAIVIGLDKDATAQMPEAKAHFNQSVWGTSERMNGAGISAGFSGAWYDPDQSGMGYQFEVLQPPPTAEKAHFSENMLVFHYFQLDGENFWLHGVGPVAEDGTSAIVPMAYTTGGGDLGEFNEDEVVRTEVGTLTVTGIDCNNAMVSFTSTDTRIPDYEFPLVRLTQIKNLPCQFLVNGKVDRNGRPAINTALIPAGTKDLYNTTFDPAQWPMFEDEMQASLEFVDGLDGVAGNALLDAATLATVLADDRLVIATNVPNCGGYLTVELTPAGQDPADCGGRPLATDVIDITLTALVGSPVSDGVDSNDREFRDEFPFLATPN